MVRCSPNKEGPGAQGPGAHMGPGPCGPWPIWALAHMGLGPYGPWPIWALAMGHGPYGLCPRILYLNLVVYLLGSKTRTHSNPPLLALPQPPKPIPHRITSAHNHPEPFSIKNDQFIRSRASHESGTARSGKERHPAGIRELRHAPEAPTDRMLSSISMNPSSLRRCPGI